jgi:hypothetical protein
MKSEDLDELVLKLVAEGKSRMIDILKSAEVVSTSVNNRDVDRALQRLRRGRKIVYTSQHGWRVVT